MKKIIVALFLLYGTALVAQNVKRPDSYNFKRGVEAYKNDNYKEAYDYFNKDIQENPKNGYSHSYIAVLRLHTKEYGKALTAANMAIKYLPKKDADYMIFTYYTRAIVYLNLEDTASAINDYSAAIKINPNDEELYERRAQIYYEQGKYDIADADYRKMIELQPGSVMGYMGIGRNDIKQKRYEDAIKQFDYVTKLANNYSSVYSFRAEAYIGLEKWNEATNDIISALVIDWDRKSWNMAQDLKEPAFSLLVSKIKVQSAKSPNEANWPYLIGIMYQQDKQFEKAIEWYNIANAKDVSPFTYSNISDCQKELGNYEEALSSINKALNMDSLKVSYLQRKASLCYNIGNVESAIAEWDKILAIDPEYAWGYYRRGWYKKLSGNTDGAIEDYTMSLALDPEYSYAYFSRGDAYKKQGKKDLANADYKKAIELESTPEKYTCIFYAYQGLGEYDKAIAAINAFIATDTTDAGNYYEAACLYSRMEDKANALKYFEKTLELGYSNFAHIERDYDLDFIRSTDEFKALINKYKSLRQTQNSGVSNASIEKESVTSEVAFTKEDGICKVKCSINGLPLFFYFDTGAADVTISMVEATFMMKNGYLKEQDIVGSQRYIDANGNVSEGTVINLKTVDFGGLELENVKASVVRNQKAPLLLGQSVLGRLGKIEIDNQRQVLIIKAEK